MNLNFAAKRSELRAEKAEKEHGPLPIVGDHALREHSIPRDSHPDLEVHCDFHDSHVLHQKCHGDRQLLVGLRKTQAAQHPKKESEGAEKNPGANEHGRNSGSLIFPQRKLFRVLRF